MAQMITCKHCGRSMPHLVDSTFEGDTFETLERHLCVSPSVSALLDDKEEPRVTEAPPSETAA